MTKSTWILLAEDNANDAELALHALSANQGAREVIVACDSAEALDCLHRRGPFEGRSAGNPAVVMLEVIVACDGAQALDCLHRRGTFAGRSAGNPAVVMLDLNMPKVDGLEALQRIKSDRRLKNIPVVMFTSSREESDIVRSYEFGANAYVVKPVDFKQFISVLKDLCRFWVLINEPPPAWTGADAPSEASSGAAMGTG